MTKRQVDYHQLREWADFCLSDIRELTQHIAQERELIRQKEERRAALEEKALALWRQMSDAERAELWEVE